MCTPAKLACRTECALRELISDLRAGSRVSARFQPEDSTTRESTERVGLQSIRAEPDEAVLRAAKPIRVSGASAHGEQLCCAIEIPALADWQKQRPVVEDHRPVA